MLRWLRKNFTTLLLLIIFAVGVGLLVYPSFSDWWNRQHQTRAIESYAQTVANMDEDTYRSVLESAYEYNRRLFESHHKLGLSDSELADYENELNAAGNGIMGYIEIGKIDVYLPIYHTTSESVLRTAVGHLEGTSLPVGGESTHCVLSGHRGLMSARLFTDLDELTEGDVFVIHTLNEELTYEVDQILIVLPDEVGALGIEEGKDYCTLLTCTPYGVNTHRMLVRGRRRDNLTEDERIIVAADATQVSTGIVALAIGIGMVVIAIIVMLLVPAGKKRKRKF